MHLEQGEEVAGLWHQTAKPVEHVILLMARAADARIGMERQQPERASSPEHSKAVRGRC
jgi:hypothetical protein